MKKLKFKCTLESDIILNEKSASTGSNKTLDFIPGNNFLGIAARELYKSDNNAEAWLIFHSGMVRFGDAHPAVVDNKRLMRALRTPAAMYYPKLRKASEELYINYRIKDPCSDEMLNKQLKQCRGGFYAFGENGMPAKTGKSFAIKSAYDRENRRSKDEQMYGYESLRKGLVMVMEVEVDDDDKAEKIKKAIEGEKRIGRSRTAQYGSVKIEECDYEETKSNGRNGEVEVYADGRLIFIDENGQPTYQPTVEDLGLKGGKIEWRKSQIRTFQYSPWNGKRKTFDTDRCGIEKGSVIVVSGVEECPEESQYIGQYKNEGFGKVIYNPDFLKADENGNAKVKLKTETDAEKNGEQKEEKIEGSTNLLRYIKRQKKTEEEDIEIMRLVNKYVEDNEGKFRGDRFASQWGTIRSIAMRERRKEELRKKLGLGAKADEKKNGYLTHGVAAEKWQKSGRLHSLEEFFKGLNESNVQKAIVNLASEMAKAIRDGENKK